MREIQMNWSGQGKNDYYYFFGSVALEIYNFDAENSMLNLRHVSQVTHIHI